MLIVISCLAQQADRIACAHCRAPAPTSCFLLPPPQITTFEEVWPLLKAKGVYMCEDTSTSMVRAAFSHPLASADTRPFDHVYTL